ncbi:AraC family transcriptional regulator [Parasalinivibrio latis]|uniref:AraC family transcriptional regulator n=1 Tax=Parasalinivibrio latis TaxID=2952610 RepID=UPI0030DE0297
MESQKKLAVQIRSRTQQSQFVETYVEGLRLFSTTGNYGPNPIVLKPSICVVVQGRKEIHIGDRQHVYDPESYLIHTVTMPVEAEVTQASVDCPFLGLSLSIDPLVVGQLVVEMDRQSAPDWQGNPMNITQSTPVTEGLYSSLERLVNVSEHHHDSSILAQNLKREVYYEVLKGPFGYMLRNCISNYAGANRIAPVVQYIEANFRKPIDIETIAAIANMSASTLYDHFRQVTTLSPMQYVKSLRLHEARSLLAGGQQASNVCYEVGYNSPSQFSREFKRFFGDSPKEVKALSELQGSALLQENKKAPA